MTSTPFKCPPAASEMALPIDNYLTRRGLRDRSEIALVMPLGVQTRSITTVGGSHHIKQSEQGGLIQAIV